MASGVRGADAGRARDSRLAVQYLITQRGMTTTTTAAIASADRNPADYDDDALDRLADLLAERLAVRLSGLAPARAEPLVDAAEIARLHGKTRSWVYEHAGELGAVRLGSGRRPRLGFSTARVAAALEKVDKPATRLLPEPPPPRRRRQCASRTATGAPLLHVRSLET
jgi:hypothetical protein